jgi:hypothetical protein
MDPNEVLVRAIQTAVEITEIWYRGNEYGELRPRDRDSAAEKAEDLAVLVLALNDWLMAGGSRPAAWGN